MLILHRLQQKNNHNKNKRTAPSSSSPSPTISTTLYNIETSIFEENIKYSIAQHITSSYKDENTELNYTPTKIQKNIVVKKSKSNETNKFTEKIEEYLEPSNVFAKMKTVLK